MRSQLQLFLLAVSFYTRIPIPAGLDYAQLAKAGIYLPVIGWIVGGVSAAVFYAAHFLWPQSTALILAVAAGILLTGAFHEDGFADVCDGFGGGFDKQRILEIMKDSQIGTYGALGILLLMALKFSSLSTIPASAVPVSLLAGHSISRFCPLLIMRTYCYARVEGGKGRVSASKPQRVALMIAGVIAALPFVLLPVTCLLAIPVIFLINWRLGRYFDYRIGGYTGDCLGASQQLAETIFYLCVSALWTFI